MIRVLWVALVLLVAIGLVSSAARIARQDFSSSVVVPARTQALSSMGIVDPIAEQRRAQVLAFEHKFLEYRGTILMHVVPGALFLLFAPLQFVRRIRQRNLAIHRWNGRVLLVLALVSVLPALFFGIVMPTGGLAETLVIVPFGVLFIGALVRAFLAIRRKQVAVHREWMIRAFAVALGIATVRVVAAPLDLLLTPSGMSSPAIFVIALAAGFGLTSLGAELWIMYTRPRSDAALSPVVA